MTRVVIDTNVFVSSFFGGTPRRIIAPWKSGTVTLCLSRPILREYVEVLRRLGLEDQRELGELLHLLARGVHTVFTVKTPKLHVVQADPEDDKFIECAVALTAEFVISGDRELTAIKEYFGIRIVTPAQFLSVSGSKGH